MEGQGSEATDPGRAGTLTGLSAGAEELRATFNAGAGHVRLLILTSPT